MKSGVRVHDRSAKVLGSMRALLRREVLVGIPAENAERQEKGETLNNATLGYIHENGAPAANTPARPFLVPGVVKAKDQINARFKKAAEAALAGEPAKMLRQLESAGIEAVSSVKNYMDSGISPALSDATLRARAKRGRKGAQAELDSRAQGNAEGTQLAKPLIDTGELRGKITYVVRNKTK